MPCLGSTRPTDGIGPPYAVGRSRREDGVPWNGDSGNPGVDISLVPHNWWGEPEHIGRGRCLVRLLVDHTGCTVYFCHVRLLLFSLFSNSLTIIHTLHGQVHRRHMAVLPAPGHAPQQIPVQAVPFMAPPALCPLRFWCTLQPPARGLRA